MYFSEELFCEKTIIEKKMKNIHLLRIIYLNYMIVKLVKLSLQALFKKQNP